MADELVARNEREYDIVVYGATGFTGKLVAEYMACRAPVNLQWAIAGRNSTKLEAVRDSLSLLDNPTNRPRGLIVAETSNLESLKSLTRTAKVVISTVGPYAKYGEPVVRACIETKTDYVDITGESIWIRDIINRYHERATADGTIIVPSCGFDSIPSDLGVFMVVDYMRAKWNKRTATVRGSLVRVKAGISGGSISSALNAGKNIWDAFATLRDPYIISPVRGSQNIPPFRVCYDADFGKWQGASPLALSDERLVQRSWGLRNSTPQPYGDRFKYIESWSYSNVVAAVFATVALFVGPLLLVIPPVRWIVRMLVPAPGTGPSRQEIEDGFFDFQVVGEAEVEPNERPLKARARIVGHNDPGYGETSKMVSESAICLALERHRLPRNGGILTPATAFGNVLIEKLRAAGMELEVGEIVSKSSKSD